MTCKLGDHSFFYRSFFVGNGLSVWTAASLSTKDRLNAKIDQSVNVRAELTIREYTNVF